MEPKPQTSKSYLSQLTLIHGAMLVTQIGFALVAYFLYATGQIDPSGADDLAKIFQIIVPVFMVASFIGGSILIRSQLKVLKSKNQLNDKLAGYRGLFLIKLALFEVPSLLSIICFLLTGKYLFLGLVALVLCLFVLQRPTSYGIVNELELNSNERADFENPNAIVSELRRPQ